ncbi:FAD:protein FMN transferase [Paracoccaceae bacterium Fryx2]|nr:FAD:protein FMN transferase [Paracoccaceae bacterium Fryx2]
MATLTRRRFIAISAAAAGLAALPAHADLFAWRGVALGAAASIHLAHPDAAAITARAVAEMARLEAIFSLYRADSALARLNESGELLAPPFELLECLALCGRVHAATAGRFDPTVQPLWALHARRYSEGTQPGAAEIAAARALVGWPDVSLASDAVRLRPGMALTLNGVAQGFVADRVADLLAAEGLTDILIDTGELRALGGMPAGGGWPVTLTTGGRLALSGRALATSATLGTVFDQAGRVGHILEPHSGLPAPNPWRQVSVSAPTAAVADALSTAACLMPDRATIEAALQGFDGARIEGLV